MAKADVKLSAEFKSQTTKAVFSIVFFVLTYLLLLSLTVGLTALCIYGGLLVIISFPRLITIIFGLGLASFGVVILIFLLKFIFKSNKVDRSHLREIKKQEAPELFNLIEEIVKEVGTNFPKKVYLSSEVNAAVFYDSNFWSMFLPIQKNLQIGLGLVNSVTKEELKAILAHEFGHFSQRTMKVGSYVYNVNQVIFNMLYDNASYEKLIQSLGNVHGLVSIFLVLAVKIVEGIQWILKKMYGVVNKSYMALSREMEFHADEIAASVTGPDPLKSSLLRLKLADHSFSNVISFYEKQIANNVKTENIYKEQAYVMNFLASENDIPLQNNLPQVPTEEIGRFHKSKLVIKNQWASHPSTEERIARLDKLTTTALADTGLPANSIFKNVEEFQKEQTEGMFKNVKYSAETSFIPFKEFEKEYSEEFNKNTFSKLYNNYYDDKNPIAFDIEETYIISEPLTLETLYSDENTAMVYTELALKNDIETLKAIANKSLPIKTFDYDGKKYSKKEIKGLLKVIEKELEETTAIIKQNDINIFRFFKKLERKQAQEPRLEALYKAFFEYDKQFDVNYKIYEQLTENLQFVSETTSIEEIRSNFRRIERQEVELKEKIKLLLSESLYQPEISPSMKENFEAYLSKEWTYFGNQRYYDNALNVLFTAMNDYSFLLSRGYFLKKKKILVYQASLALEEKNKVLKNVSSEEI